MSLVIYQGAVSPGNRMRVIREMLCPLTGRQIQENYGVEPQVILTLPILPGTDGVLRMSKSTGNYIGISEDPYEMTKKFMIYFFYRDLTILFLMN